MGVFKPETLLVFVSVLSFVSRSEACVDTSHCDDHSSPLPIKLIGIASILVSSMIGVCLPLFTRSVPALHPDKNLFVVVKTFSSGIILGTGFMHVLPDSFSMLQSPCLPKNPWHNFPFSGFLAMLSAILTMLMDSFATSVYSNNKGTIDASMDKEAGVHEMPSVDMNGGGHSHGNFHSSSEGQSKLLRHRVIAMVLELGIIVHSVIIGLSLGASSNVCTVRGLIAALCFHQMFEGLGLGGCIVQAEYSFIKKSLMAFFFAVTTPFGIVLGIALSEVYTPGSTTSLITEGLLNAASAGLLIYMALVDLLAVEFMGKKLQQSIKLQGVCGCAVLVGAGTMSLLAKWA